MLKGTAANWIAGKLRIVKLLVNAKESKAASAASLKMIPAIIPYYKNKAQLTKCLEHLKRQTVEVEPFVRDNSVDNVFFTAAVNEGILRYLDSPCEHILTINQDMYLAPDAVAELVACMERQPRCGIASPLQMHPRRGDQVLCGGCEDAFPFGKHKSGPLAQFGEDAATSWANGACLLFRKKMIQEIGLLDRNLVFVGSDSDYCLTAQARGWTVWVAAKARGVHEHGGASGAVSDKAIDLLKLNDMLYFGRKWLTGDLYRSIAFEGGKLPHAAVLQIMEQLEAVKSKL